MRFTLLSLIFLVAVVALAAVTLSLKRTPDELILIGGHVHVDTWELEKSAGDESLWPDKSQPPKLSVPDAFQISESVCRHLNTAREEIGVGSWQTVSLSLESLGEQRWAYFVRIEGTDYPDDRGQRIVKQVTFMILLDRSVVLDFGSCPTEYRDTMNAFS